MDTPAPQNRTSLSASRAVRTSSGMRGPPRISCTPILSHRSRPLSASRLPATTHPGDGPDRPGGTIPRPRAARMASRTAPRTPPIASLFPACDAMPEVKTTFAATRKSSQDPLFGGGAATLSLRFGRKAAGVDVLKQESSGLTSPLRHALILTQTRSLDGHRRGSLSGI